jgi:preprotein translocase subunit SecA
LIDEVDVFFGQSFYGNLYQPSLVVKDECIQNLIKFIWEQRKNNVNYQMVYDSEQFKACLKEVPNFKELLIEGIKDMLFDVKEIDKHKDYIVEKERIGYLNGDQYVFNAQMGYLTQFAYIREHADSSISEDSLKQNLGLRVNCGAYSFAKIPEKFRLILGVTGTLQNVTETQRDIISRKYKILEETYMPSVFGKSNLRYNHKDNFIVVSKKEYWSRIRKEIDTQLQGINGVKNSRAALVIFENERALKEFQLSVHCQEIRT